MEVVAWIYWIAGTLPFSFGCFMVFMNWMGVYRNMRNRRRGIDKHESSVPFFGPILILAGLYVAPIDFQIWFWSIWLLDPIIYYMLMGLPSLICEWKAK